IAKIDKDQLIRQFGNEISRLSRRTIENKELAKSAGLAELFRKFDEETIGKNLYKGCHKFFVFSTKGLISWIIKI
ncbi:MAG: hypothetical protein Q8907_13860, partial [Bacteroidota bacterium]|nr:hypothetical protein [Bacteroidota bacterium]